MNAHAVIDELSRRKVQVTAEDGNLDLEYPAEAPLPADLIEAIRENKCELVAHYRLGPRPERCDACGHPELSPRNDGRAWICDRCHPVWVATRE